MIVATPEPDGRERNHKDAKSKKLKGLQQKIGRAAMSNHERLKRSPASLLAFLFVGCCVFAAGDPDYRLAGIVAVGPDRLIAVIEMPDGRQGLFRPGDALGEGRVGDITRTDVRVEMTGQTFLLSLRGN